ncbi:MAG: ATP-binding protein, partial [Promethearchaeota archaeon]
MSDKVGIVFNFLQLPDVHQFPFVIDKLPNDMMVKKGQFVYTKSIEGFLIGMVEKIILLNEYFSDALTIKAYNSSSNPNILKGLFPSDEFEYAIALVKNLGIVEFKDEDKKKIKLIKRMTYPASPGKKVFLVEANILKKFIGLDYENGLNIGNLKIANIEAKININRLINKHFSILSISGGGKSYLASILLEELLSRPNSIGTPAIIIIDVHGEYTYLKSIPELQDKIKLFDGLYLQISVPQMNAYSFRKYQSQITSVQVRELNKYIKKLKQDKSKKGNYSLRDIITLIDEETEGNKTTRQALIGWLTELDRLNVFGTQENPILKNSIKPGELTIFNFQNEISIRKKQILVDYLCNRLFHMRRMDELPPFLLIIEEAHQFCPEAAQSKAISKSIIETIAREGRKFMAC